MVPYLRHELMRFLDACEALGRLQVETASRADPEEETKPLRTLERIALQPVVRDALIEAAAAHARSLYEFLEGDAGEGAGLASARDFVPDWKTRRELGLDSEARAALHEAQPSLPRLSYERVGQERPPARSFERVLAFLVPRLEELGHRAASSAPPIAGLGQLDSALTRARTALTEVEGRLAQRRALERQEALERRRK